MPASADSKWHIGVIGGSGLADGIALEDAQEIRVSSPFGEPSGPVTTGRLGGVRFTFLARHGAGHRIPPGDVDYRANIDVLKRCRVTDVLLKRHIGAVVDTYFKTPYLNRLLMRLVRDSDEEEAHRIADSYLTPLSQAYDRLIEDGIAQGVFRKVDPQLFYFTVTGAADRFFSARLVLRHCFDTDTLTEQLRDRYREHCIDFIMAGILAK